VKRTHGGKGMDIARLYRHLACTRWHVRRAFPPRTLVAIERAIAEAESTHDGQIRFVVEGALDGAALLAGQTPRERAMELFSLLRVWDTAADNGVLVYILLADHAVEIVADRGIHAEAGEGAWAAVCRDMEAACARGDFLAAAKEGVTQVARRLEHATRRRHARGNELPDAPIVLR